MNIYKYNPTRQGNKNIDILVITTVNCDGSEEKNPAFISKNLKIKKCLEVQK